MAQIKIIMAALITVLLITGLPDAVRADIFRWTDGTGTLHYTSSLDNVPSAYRSRVETIATLQPSEARPDLPEEHIINFMKAHDSIILVDVLLNDEVKARMVLDTGASLVVISGDLARRLRQDSSNASGTIKLQTAGGEIEGQAAVIDRIELGSAVREKVRAVINRQPQVFKGFDGLLGSSFLDGYKVTIDYQQNKIHLKRP